MATMATRRTKAVERVETPVFLSFYGKLIGVGVFVLAVAFFIGTRDSGQININGVITASNAERAENPDMSAEGVQNVAAIPESLRNLPNGGLVPADPNLVATPQPETTQEQAAEESASTTPEDGGEPVEEVTDGESQVESETKAPEEVVTEGE